MKPIYIANSCWFSIFASVFYFSVLAALVLSNWPWWLSGALGVLLLLDYQRVITLYGLRTNRSAVAIVIPDCDQWQYQLFSGKQYKAKLIKQRSFCSQLVLIMHMRSMNGSRYVIIPRDALSEHNYRFLAMQINN